MKCEKCGKEMRVSSKNGKSFVRKRGYLCDTCYKLYPISLGLTIIPLKMYKCTILSVFTEEYNVNYNYFIWEYNYIFHRYWDTPECFLLFMDSLRLNKSTLAVLDVISRLFRKNIFLLVFFIKK